MRPQATRSLVALAVSATGWFFLSLLITPLFSLIILLILPKRFKVGDVWMTEHQIQQAKITREFSQA